MNSFDARQAAYAPRVLQVLQEAGQDPRRGWDRLPVAAGVFDADGRLVVLNRRAREMWGQPPELREAPDLRSFSYALYSCDGRRLAPDEWPTVQTLRNGCPTRDETLILERWDGTRTAVAISVEPVREETGVVVGALACFHTTNAPSDAATERAPTTDGDGRLREIKQRLDVLYDHAGIGVVEADATGLVLNVNDAMCAMTGCARDELIGRTMFHRTHPDDVGCDRFNYSQQVTGNQDHYSIEKRFVKKDGSMMWLSVLSSTVRDSDGAFVCGLRIVLDVTDRKLADERRQAMSDEVIHRIETTLDTVRSLAVNLADGAATSGGFGSRLDDRIAALTRAHTRLSRTGWQSVDLYTTVKDVLEPYRAGSVEICAAGAPVRMNPRATTTMALVLYELATNAARHGSLSVPGGTLDVSWRIERGVASSMLILDWLETGGPNPGLPRRQGCGSRVLDWGVIHQLQGNLDIRLAPMGLSCRITAPMTTLGI